MSDQKTFESLLSATSSPGSAGGPAPSGSPGGQTAVQPGPGAAPASPSPAPEKGKAQKMIATSGRPLCGSSESESLSMSLASKLKQLLPTTGSTVYRQTWRRKRTPLGRLYWEHTASAPTTSESASTGQAGWSTASARDYKDVGDPASWDCKDKRERFDQLGRQATLASWPTPAAGSPNSLRGQGQDPDSRREGGHQVNLQDAARLAGWPTPNAMEGGQTSRGGDRKDEPLMGGVAKLTGWPTPNTNDTGKSETARQGGENLSVVSGWTTPQAHDSHPRGVGQSYESNGAGNSCLARDAQTSGPTPTGTSAETGSTAVFRLNPRFSLWLMGYPEEWACCGERAMLSCRKSRKRSSKP